MSDFLIKRMRKQRFRTILFIFVLVFTAVLNFLPHLNTIYPLHIDEWHHIAVTRSMMAGDGIYWHGFSYKDDIEMGFHLFLALLRLIGIDLVVSYFIFPMLFVVLSQLCLYLLVRYLTKNFYAGIAAMIFFASIRTNVNILGSWFFIPLTFCFPLLFLFCYTFLRGTEEDNSRFLLFSGALLLLILFIHPASAIFIAPVVLVHCLVNIKTLIKNKKIRISLFFVAALIIIMAVDFYMNKLFHFSGVFHSHLKYFYEHMIFVKGWGVYEKIYNIPQLYTYPITLFALIGLVSAWKKRVTRFFTLWVILCSANLLLFYLNGRSYFVPYQRMVYYTLLGLVILSAIGFCNLTSYLQIVFKKKNQRIAHTATLVAIPLLMILIFSGYYEVPSDVRLYQLLEDEDYRAFKWLESKDKGIVLAEPAVATVVYPISGQKPVATLRFQGTDELRSQIRDFYINNCTEQYSFAKEHKVKYVYSEDEINCSWQLIYGKSRFIYKIN